MPLIHTSLFRVRHYECDAYGHLNNLNYLRFMQEAAFDASAAAGYDLQRYQAMHRHWVVRQTVPFCERFLAQSIAGFAGAPVVSMSPGSAHAEVKV